MDGDPTLTLLHVFPSFARGGQQMRLAAIVAAAPNLSHHIVSLDGDLSAREIVPEARAEAFDAAKSPLISLSNLRRLNELIGRVNPAVLCTYNFGAIEAAIANALWRRIPHIHYEDGFGADETGDRQKWRRVLMRRLALRRSLVAAPSRTLEAVALNKWRLPPRNVRRIPNGIDVAKFARPVSTPRSNEDVVIGSVGALRPEKNFERLIMAFLKLPEKARARLVIVGDGPEKDRLAALAAADRRIALPGATATPELAYRAFDIFALSSKTEQMPLSLMEAMAAGLPVVATDVGDVREMLGPENREFVTPGGDADAFQRALRRLIDDVNLRERLGAANVLKAEREFCLDAMIAAHEGLYREALARRGDRVSSSPSRASETRRT